MAFGDADRAVFLEPAVFGSVVVAGSTTGRGVLRLQWLEGIDGGGLPYKAQRPTLQVARGMFDLPAVDDPVTVGGVAYVYRGKVGASHGAARVDGGFEVWVLSEVSS